MLEVAALMAEVLRNIHSQETVHSVRRRVLELVERFPLYPWKLSRVPA
jgi:glycine/serine hydroxymethyltransferase